MNKTNIKNYGYTEKFETLSTQYDSTLTPARITAVFQGMYEIATDNGIGKAKLRGNYILNHPTEEEIPTVGDFVLVDYQHGAVSMIHHLLNRSSLLVRKATGVHKRETQMLGANIDYAFIITSMNKDFNVGRIERYLTAIYQGGITPVIVLSKSDLCENPYDHITQLNDVAFGMDVITTSSVNLEGIEQVKALLKPNKTVIFMGSSGVGKSSLLNAIAGETLMHVNTIRDDDDKGRHTTTHRQLIMLENGCMLIDTPGMREFNLHDADEYVDETFSDITELAKQCHFKNCRHDKEIKCAVKQAIDEGTLDADRLKQYNKQKKVDAFYEKRDYIKNKEKAMKGYYDIGKQARKRKRFDGYDY